MASGFLVFLCQPYEVFENKDFSPVGRSGTNRALIIRRINETEKE